MDDLTDFQHQTKDTRLKTSPVLTKIRAQTKLREAIDNTKSLEEFHRAKNTLDLFPEDRRRKVEEEIDARIKRRQGTYRLNSLLKKAK